MSNKQQVQISWLYRLLLLAIVLQALSNHWHEQHHLRGKLTECKSNLKNLGVAMELYQIDRGDYPSRLSMLTPEYLKAVPDSPNAKNEYTLHFMDSTPPGFIIVCNDPLHHEFSGKSNFSAYDSRAGLLDLTEIEQ